MHFVNSAVPKDPKGNAYSIKTYQNISKPSKTAEKQIQHGSMILVSAHLDGRREEVRSIRFGLRQTAAQCFKMTVI